MKQSRTDPGPKVAAHHRAGSGLTRVPYPIGVRRASITRITSVTPAMTRLTFGGDGLQGLHTYQADDHVRIVFPDPDGTQRDPVPNAHDMLDWPHPFPPTRKYTIRRYDPVALELDLDFVLHEGGLASTWVRGAAVGEDVTIAGPPGAEAFPHTYGHYAFVVDATALPALGRWLDESPPDVSAHVVVTGDERAYPLAARERVTVTYDEPDAVRGLPLPEGTFLFAAGEATALKPVRTWARGRLDHLVTGYWKRGVAAHSED
ncbi:siderophore-interacting protein [Cryptosporangium minutisporangium]|uniref:Siderophore-interacting protein n=1 Tax=Cryptosporangium minutisporangium TaxID=113569 RepID=A0ABP6TBM9_9ACTN